MRFEDLYNLKNSQTYITLYQIVQLLWTYAKIVCYSDTPKSFSGCRDGAVVKATRHALDGPGIFSALPVRSQGPTSPLYNGYRLFSGGRSGRGVVLTNSLLPAPRLQMV